MTKFAQYSTKQTTKKRKTQYGNKDEKKIRKEVGNQDPGC